ncbi:MAG: carbohydrate kinase family protein [Candidatus Saccharibacteria bacterium]|nr:carbohydrate kinase family protein [Candidatus Saccharibacteria bacterium]
MSKVPTILCIGKSTQDVFLLSEKNFAAHGRGSDKYEQLPLGNKLELDDVVFSTGGNVTNAAVTFARQNLHSKYVWAIGTDLASETILKSLDDEGVETSGVVQDEKYRASYSTILLANNGERTILNYHGTKLASDGHPLGLDALEAADWVYLSSLGDIKLLEKIISLAARYNTKVMLNPAGTELQEKVKLKSLLDDVEILAVNKEEAKKLVSGETLDELVRHATNYCPVVIVSDGPNGVVATDSKEIVRAGMYEDVPVIDRTGAGDAFGSGFLSQWVQGRSLSESIIFASANSTSVVTKIGAKEGILHEGVKLHHMPIDTKPF